MNTRNRMKRITILTLAILALAITGTAAGSEVTFVLGTDENRASLENASRSVTVNICNATQALSMNFANESVLFLASLDNETASWINNTINQSTNIIAYNLSTNLSIGNVDDVNITKYWVYGGDENIENLITYMDNKFYGNATAVDQPKPPEGRAKTAFVVQEKTSYAAWLERASDDLYISRCLNISLCTYAADDPKSYQGMNMSDQNVIVLWMLGDSVQGAIKGTVLEARSKGADVIYISGGVDIYGISSVNLSSPEFADISTYWANGGIENMRRLLLFTGVKFCDIPIADFGLDEIPPPLETPQYGIYHPDAKDVGEGIQGLGIFSSVDDYLEWYKETGRYNESAPTVGIHYFYASGKDGSYQTLDTLIRMIEDKGANVIFATFASPETDPNTTAYLFKDGEPLVDSLILLKSFRLWYGSEDKGIAYLQDLNVTPIKGIMSSANQSRWEESNGLSPSEIAYKIALPELDGATEFIIFSGNEEDPVSGEYYCKPFDYQLDWITDRTISWAKLHRKDNAEKKIAIIYYNHGGGKDNLGATYLDIIPSLKTLLAEMKEDRYKIEGEVPDEKELLDLMLHQGRNIGTWAPGELKSMVETGSVVLIPAEEYEAWFNELPANKRQEVIEKWGEPPGEVMVYANETGKYLVIPKLSFGNVLLAPQPTRGWLQNESVLYHDKELAPHHQNIAFYLWLKKEYGADAIVHFGTHGTLEWLPGKETALSVNECWPAILIQDLPVVYPYIMDNVGEGTQAKRRGNAVIVDYLTPPIVASGLYGNFSLLHEKIHQYLDLGAEEALKPEYRNTITELYENLSLSEDLGVSVDDLRAMNETDFKYFVNGELHLHLHALASEFIPYGLHILGSPPVDWKLVSMVESMLGDDFADHIEEVYPDPHELNPAHGNCTVMEGLLRAVIFNGSSPDDAQKEILGPENVSSNVTADLNTAKVYAENLARCTIEIPRILDGLAGRYVPPKTGNDPIRNPDALPTGNNFHSFDPRLIPTKEAWAVGKVVADNLLSQYREEHNGSYPNKSAFVLWSIETMRHQGVMESQILYLLGTRPVWDSRGRVKDVELIPSSKLNRSRIEVLISTSGLYRDTFPDKVKLLDKAVRLAAQAENDTYPNYVMENSDAIYKWLLNNTNYTESEARSLSMARVFAMSPGNYGIGLENAIAASNTWENETKLANLFINRMGYVYGEDGWGVPNIYLFKQNLADVEVVVHSDSSNLFGMLDTDDYFQHLGGLALAVRSITGETPDLYITNLRDPHDPKTETLKSYLRRELNARYFNPRWIEGMMGHDYAGAREMMKFTEHLWGWDVVTPDLITDDMWNQVYDIYVQDRYNLGMKDFFDSNNAYAYQSITARMLEAARKLDAEGNPYWDATPDVIESLVREYVESVAEHGATCCHHTCGNPLLDEFVSGIISAPYADADVVSSEIAATYRETMDKVAGRTSTSSQPTDTGSSGGGDGTYPPSWFNETEQTIQQAKSPSDSNETTIAGGIGEDITKPVQSSQDTNPSEDYVEGQKMEETETFQTAPSSSSAPLLAIIAVIVILALIGIGLRFKRK